MFREDEVLWFDVAVDEGAGVEVMENVEHLGKEEEGSERAEGLLR